MKTVALVSRVTFFALIKRTYLLFDKERKTYEAAWNGKEKLVEVDLNKPS